MLHKLSAAFDAVTLIDTRPFYKASHRQRGLIVNNRLRWKRSPMPEGALIDQLLKENIETAAASLPLIPLSVTHADRLIATYVPSVAANDARHESAQISFLDQLTSDE